MANLLDTIRQNNQAAATQKQGVTDETGKLAALLRAKSGKEVGGGDFSSSNLGEQQAVANTNTQTASTLAPAVQVQTAGLETQQAAQQQQVDAQKSELAQNRRFDTIQARIKTDALLQDLEQNKGRIDQQRKDAAVNQVAQNLRLQNSQYIDSLQKEGARSRLDDENSFNEELAKTTFGDNRELLEKSLGNKSILDASDNEFSVAMGQMTQQNAYDIFRNDMKAEKERGMMGAIGGLVTSAVGAAASGGGSKTPAASSPAGSSASDYTSLGDGKGNTSHDYTSLKG